LYCIRGCTPSPSTGGSGCAPYRARTKGKDERGVGYVKRNAIAGRSFATWSALEAHLAAWTREIADLRVHGTTGEAPGLGFARDEAPWALATGAAGHRPPSRSSDTGSPPASPSQAGQSAGSRITGMRSCSCTIVAFAAVVGAVDLNRRQLQSQRERLASLRISCVHEVLLRGRNIAGL